ncbi:hypothetical protein Cadr_000010201 [Camelus dromedarius]|uniref:Secreted protein n=1 Tax=Camelus dromedarius TaxID=9838 RepID=A0A5N4DWJ1_CAMDR|nr:hypothetical protein Cadr_000010201 [Camelus dromedarius]
MSHRPPSYCLAFLALICIVGAAKPPSQRIKECVELAPLGLRCRQERRTLQGQGWEGRPLRFFPGEVGE